MATENWFESFKRRRAEKKIKKLRHQFSFLLEEFKLEKENIIDELKRHQESVARTSALFIEQKLSGSEYVTKRLFEGRAGEILDFLQEWKTESDGNKKKLHNLSVEIAKKIDELKESNFKNQERISSIQDSINQSKDKSKALYDDVKKILQNIELQLETIQKGARDIADTTERVIHEKTNGIMLNFEEIKTLMKVVAVNNLIEEI